eukprot:gene15015-22921_t
MVAACVLSFVLLKAAQQCKPAASQSDLQGVLRLPAVVMLAGRVLYASSVLAAARLFIHTPHFGFLVLAMLICMACVMTPVVLFWKLKTGVPEKTLFVEDGKFTSKRVTSLVLGPGEWVNKSSETHWVARYGAMFKEYERGTVWWTSFEMVFDFMLAVVSAMETDGAVACGHVKFACGILCLMRLVCLLLVRPYSRGMSFAADAVASAMECAATLLVAVSMYAGRGRDFWLADAAATLLATAAVVWGIGVVLDLGAEAYVVCSGRRRRLQNLSLKLPEEGDHALECFLSEPAVLESTVSESEQVSSASGTFRTMSNRSARPPLSLDATLLRISSPSSTLSPPAEARFTPRHSLPAALRPVPSAEANVVYSGRRRRLQNLSLKLPEEGDVALECFLPEPACQARRDRSARPPLSLDATLLRISSPSSTLSPPAEARFTPRHILPAALRPVPSDFIIDAPICSRKALEEAS